MAHTRGSVNIRKYPQERVLTLSDIERQGGGNRGGKKQQRQVEEETHRSEEAGQSLRAWGSLPDARMVWGRSLLEERKQVTHPGGVRAGPARTLHSELFLPVPCLNEIIEDHGLSAWFVFPKLPAAQANRGQRMSILSLSPRTKPGLRSEKEKVLTELSLCWVPRCA